MPCVSLELDCEAMRAPGGLPAMWYVPKVQVKRMCNPGWQGKTSIWETRLACETTV